MTYVGTESRLGRLFGPGQRDQQPANSAFESNDCQAAETTQADRVARNITLTSTQ
jgi:hypothetical protein